MVSLNLPVMRTSNIDAMLRFYSALGLVFVEEQHGSGPIHYACELGNIVIEIYSGEAGGAPNATASGSTTSGFQVETLDAVLADLKQLGIEPLSPPKDAAWGRHCTVLDPDNRRVILSQSAAPT